MIRKILFLVAVFLGCTASAQNVQFKIGGGLASHYSGAEVVGAFKVGVGYEIEIDQKWSFVPGLEFYGKGWKDPDERVFVFDDEGNQLFDEETGEPLTGIRSRSASQNYISFPLLFSYYLRTGEARYVVFSAGPYLACGISGKQKTKGDTESEGAHKLYYESKTFKEPGAHRFDMGFQTRVAYQFASGMSIGLEADFGLTKFNRAGDRNVSGLISLGYTFK